MGAKTVARILVGAVGVSALLAGTALAHDDEPIDDGVLDSGKETHHHDDHQHGENEGHLPAVQHNVEVIGHTDLFADGEQPGRIADVSAHGNYAYLTVFREPDCDRGGVQVVDISDPASPTAGPLIPSNVGTFSAKAHR